MNITINAVGFNMQDEDREYLDKKFERVKYADDLITDVICNIKEDKKYIYNCTVNFKWGATAHVSSENYDFKAGVNKMMDTLDTKINKEKENAQEK